MTRSIYSVGQINAYIKNMFAQEYFLRGLYVRGEVSNCKYHSSGHIYFSLKDEKSVLSCVMFAGNKRNGLRFRMKDGDKVVIRGTVSVYERDGRYQLYAEEITLEGAGLLYQRFEELKKRLAESGMFAQEYKRPIPQYVKTVGIVTAQTGAAIRDIVNVAGRRNPYVQLILYPARVQGEGAAESVVEGIRALNAYGTDVIIVGRGGGSIEDLWAFNEEIVARAIFESRIPVISAVGHETDVTIADFAADLRAPTPSAAAEQAVFDVRKTLEKLSSDRQRLDRTMAAHLLRYREKMTHLKTALEGFRPSEQIRSQRMYLGELQERMELLLQGRTQQYRQRLSAAEKQIRPLMEHRLAAQRHRLHTDSMALTGGIERVYTGARHRLAVLAAQMEAVSPLGRLAAGYAWLTDGEKRPVRSVRQLKAGDDLYASLSDGTVRAQVREITEKEHE